MKAAGIRSSFVLSVFLYTASPGGAQTPLGALAIDERQGDQYGWAVNFETAGAARQRALSECGSGCAVVLTFERCAAYAVDQDAGSTAFGWAESYDSAAGARQRALAECGSRGGSRCTVRAWGCNGHVVEDSLGLGRAVRRVIQESLQAAGFDPGGVDGLFGPRTRAAIRSWQTSRGTRATGYLDNASAAALRPSVVTARTFSERSGADAAPAPEAVPEEQQAASAGQPAAAVSAELEALFWQSIVDSENPMDFEAYLAQFPNGVFRHLAENRLSALQPVASPPVASAAPEALFWQSIVNSENPADFEAYLDQFSNGVFRRLAENRLSALQPVAPPPAVGTAVEDLFWQSIANSENPAEFEAYLAQFPNGVFRNLAQNRLSALQSPSGIPARVSGRPANIDGSPAGGEVCGVPADEAVLVTWQNTADNWNIVTPAGNRIASFSSERDALGSWADVATFECEVAILVNFREFTGRFYRLNRKMQAGETDARSLFIGDPAVAADGYRESVQRHGALAIDVEGGRHSVSPAGEAHALSMCGTADCEVVATFSSCMGVAYSLSTRGPTVWAWMEAGTAGDARVGALGECTKAGGPACEVLNVVCLDAPDVAGSPASGSRVAAAEAAADPVLRPGDVFQDCDECPEMVVLPDGRLAMGRYEVMMGEWQAFRRATCCPEYSFPTRDRYSDEWWSLTHRHPAVTMNWEDAQEYASWLSRSTGATYRLPTEAEWERAATGSRPGCVRSIDDGPCPAGSYSPNAAGLSDMIGNVWEWTSARARGRSFSNVARGGGWFSTADKLRPDGRDVFSNGNSWLGFRVVRTLE